MEPQKLDVLKGNPWWAITYALTSLRNAPIRNMGIALILSIGVALPTTVFVWTTTGTDIVVDNYFTSNPVQMAIGVLHGTDPHLVNLDGAARFTQRNWFIEKVYTLPNTVCVLRGDYLPVLTSYNMYGLNYYNGIKDGRMLFVDNDFLGNTSSWFSIEGNFSLTEGEVLVSRGWLDYVYDVYHQRLHVGDRIDLEFYRRVTPSFGGDVEDLNPQFLSNYSIAGIYTFGSKSDLAAAAFPSISRQNWDPLGPAEPVMGIRDSVMVLSSELTDAELTEVTDIGFFTPSVFIQPDKDHLKSVGAANIANTLINLKSQIEEAYDGTLVDGLYDLWRLNALVSTYMSSQVLTVIALPILVMSMMLTVFTSETSIARRKGEISALRAKGASFNQVFSTFMWESIFLSIIGLAIGLTLAVFMAPLIAASTSIFTFDYTVYSFYLSRTQFSPLSIIIAATIAMYLPASYLVHVARRIDVAEIGQPIIEEPEEAAEDISVKRYGLGLALSMAILFSVPIMVSPTSYTALAEIIVVTLLLFTAAYLGSRFMQVVTARLSGGTSFIMGEKSLYLSKSLRRRRRQFIPLLVILTLTLTTTTMMVIQSTSFEATMENEIRYALGADMRIECNGRLMSFNETLLTYPGIQNATPIIVTLGTVGSTKITVTGVDPDMYLRIGSFTDESFVSGSPAEVLSALGNTSNGVVISQYHSTLWNKTIGDEIRLVFIGGGGGRVVYLKIVGIMRSAPGLGVASSNYLTDPTIGTIFGFQTYGDGFLMANLNYLSQRGSINRVDLFLAETLPYVNLTTTIRSLNRLSLVNAYTPETFNIEARSYSLGLFLSGFQGLAMIGFVMCTFMGLSALALFLGSAVLERQSEYALFRSMGGTRKQVVSMVFGEFAGSVVTAIAISAILGVLFGFSMSILSFGISPFSPVLVEVLAYPLVVLLGILCLESVVMLLSCYIPARRAGMVNPATTLRNL